MDLALVLSLIAITAATLSWVYSIAYTRRLRRAGRDAQTYAEKAERTRQRTADLLQKINEATGRGPQRPGPGSDVT